MTHNVRPNDDRPTAGNDRIKPAGPLLRFERWTQAKLGQDPTMDLVKLGKMRAGKGRGKP